MSKKKNQTRLTSFLFQPLSTSSLTPHPEDGLHGKCQKMDDLFSCHGMALTDLSGSPSSMSPIPSGEDRRKRSRISDLLKTPDASSLSKIVSQFESKRMLQILSSHESTSSITVQPTSPSSQLSLSNSRTTSERNSHGAGFGLLDLPCEMLLLVYDYLSMTDRVALLRLCKRSYIRVSKPSPSLSLSMTSLFWRDLSFVNASCCFPLSCPPVASLSHNKSQNKKEASTLSVLPKLNVSKIQLYLSRSGRSLRSLTLHGGSFSGIFSLEKVLSLLSSSCSLNSLKLLKISDTKFWPYLNKLISSSIPQQATVNLNHLQSFSMEHSIVSITSLISIMYFAPYLQVLTVQHCQLDAEDIPSPYLQLQPFYRVCRTVLDKRYKGHMKSLHFGGNNIRTNLIEVLLRACFRHYFRDLKSLSLIGFPLTLDFIKTSLLAFPQLEHIDLSKSDLSRPSFRDHSSLELTQREFCEIMTSLASLKYVYLSQTNLFSPSLLKHIFSLIELDLSYQQNIKDDDIQMIGRHHPSLKFLSLEGCQSIQNADVFWETIKNCSHIERLNLSCCLLPIDQLFTRVLQFKMQESNSSPPLKCLTEIYLKECPNMSASSLLSFLRSFGSQLSTLDIRGCTKITPQIIPRIRSYLNKHCEVHFHYPL